MNVFGFKTNNLRTQFFGEAPKGVLQQNGFFFINLCFAKCEKLSFFFAPFFCPILVDVQKSTIKIGISAHF